MRWGRSLVEGTHASRERCGALTDEAAVVARARENSAEVAALLGEERYLFAAAEVSRADPPQLRLDKLRLDRMIDGPGRFELGLRVPFARPGTLDARADALRQEALAARADAAEEGRRVALEARVALTRYLGWKALAAHAARESAAARAEADRLQRGAGDKETPASELALAELAALTAEGDEARAEGEAARWLGQLTARLGGDCTLAFEGPPPSELPEGDRERLVDVALAERPSLALRAARASLASAHAWEARAAAWPWFDWAQLGYELTDDPSPRTWTFSLGIDLPVGAWGGAGVQAAEAEQRGADDAARREANAIVAEVDAALAEVEARRAELARVTAARDRFDAERLAKLERGVAGGFVDPATAFRVGRELRQLEQRRLEVLIDLGEARARLLAALGR